MRSHRLIQIAFLAFLHAGLCSAQTQSTKPTPTEGDYIAHANSGGLQAADIVYVFPWPDQIDTHHALFQSRAKPGSRLLIYSQTMEMLESIHGFGDGALRPA